MTEPLRQSDMRRLSLLLAITLFITGCGGGADDPIDSPAPTPSTIPDDAGPVFVETTDILLMESFPVQVVLRVTGNLPTPCHQAVWEV
ncbi:MAG TPA: hypothetical protein VFT54_05100, partial [Acidimicrobiia bacterium]|nr:hypothetical protein [Acidimicrobiia bacterium]